MLISADHTISLWLNHAGSPWLDNLMILWSAKWLWIPLYIFLAAWLYNQLGVKRTLLALLMLALIIGLSDQTASALFKPAFERLRPCHDPELIPFLKIPDGCGGKFGFASSHAANTMAIAVYFLLLPIPFRSKKGITAGLFFWALMTGWSRIYLGVHFAGDILGGFAIGCFWASFLHLVARHLRIFNEKKENQTN